VIGEVNPRIAFMQGFKVKLVTVFLLASDKVRRGSIVYLVRKAVASSFISRLTNGAVRALSRLWLYCLVPTHSVFCA
jgi:hypothetical protein